MRRMRGFSIIELFFALAIICALGLIAYPAFQNYYRRMVYADILKNVESYKVSISTCYNTHHNFKNCNAGENHIAKDIHQTGSIESLNVRQGVISLVPKEQNGILSTDSYILTPVVKNGEIEWMSSGKAVTNAYAN